MGIKLNKEENAAIRTKMETAIIFAVCKDGQAFRLKNAQIMLPVDVEPIKLQNLKAFVSRILRRSKAPPRKSSTAPE